MARGEPGTVSNFVLAHMDCEKSSPREARRSIGGRFLAKEGSKESWFSDRGEKRGLWWALEAVVDTEEMDEVGEGGRGNSSDGALEIDCSSLERSR